MSHGKVLSKRYYLGVDQGTTGTTALLLDEEWNVAAQGYREVRQIYPQDGWVEHDPQNVLESVLGAVKSALDGAGTDISHIISMGIANQGESCMAWNRRTGQPVYNALVWQDRRTARKADALAREHNGLILKKTGVEPSSYFSATKLQWILEQVDCARELAERGDLLVGTLDSWIIWKLSGGREHATDHSTASRTMLLNIHTGEWDDEILNLLQIPKAALPKIRSSADRYGTTEPSVFFGAAVPITGNLVDQQAALFGQACFTPGSVKATYGTGCFMLMNTGPCAVRSKNGMLTTVGWSLDGKLEFALDGGIYIAGAAIQWLRDKLQIVTSARDVDVLAAQVPDNGGVYFVPAFVGLAAPHWDQYARGTMVGLTGGTGREHIARATLESVAYQVKDNLEVMEQDSDIAIHSIRADGGMVNSELLMQFQADILGIPVDIPEVTETTALGAAYMSAYGMGAFHSLHEIAQNWKLRRRFEPAMSGDRRQSLLHQWHRAVERSKAWKED